MITANVYVWPERGDVDYFLSKISAKRADCRLDQNKKGTSRHSNDENGMICVFC